MHSSRDYIKPRTNGEVFSVWDTGRDAFAFTLGHKGRFLRLATGPLAIYLSAHAGTFYLWGIAGFDGRATFWLTTLLAALTIPFAVSWHRLALLGPWAIGSRHGLVFGKREVLFLLCYAALAPLAGFLGALIETTGRTLANSGLTTGSIMFLATVGAIGIATFVLALSVLARLALVFPAIATDEGANPLRAWRLTRNNGWRVLGVILLTGMLTAIVLNFIGVLVALTILFAGGPHAGLIAAIATGALMDGVMVFATVAVGASGLSLVYRILTEDPAPMPAESNGRKGRYGRRQPVIN